MPPNLYAISDQITSGFGPDVLTLQVPDNTNGVSSGAIATKNAPPKMRFQTREEVEPYAAKARTLVIRRTSEDRIVEGMQIFLVPAVSAHRYTQHLPG